MLVIGAGHNGLVAAIHLAAAGAEVTVLEQSRRVGGAALSGEATLPGFMHDHCAGFVPMAAASPAIRELELEREGVVWIDPQHVLAHPFDDGTALALHRDVEATVASLGAAGGGWRRAMAAMLPLAEPLVQTVLSPLPPVAPLARLARGLRSDLPRWTRRLLGSVQALGLELFGGDTRATAWLAGSAQHSGLPPTTTVSGAFGFLLNLLGHSHGWPLPQGGMGELVAALQRRAEREGARVRCSAAVQEILLERGRVAGVLLDSGERIPAQAVISTLSAGAFARLLPGHELARGLAGWRYGTGAFKIDYALDGPVPWSAHEARESAVVHVGGELDELVAAAEAGARGGVPERPALVVGQQSLLDPTRAPVERR
ncbi:MAG: phytoene desaturase family protein [Solirubrobacteraceae bacterium]